MNDTAGLFENVEGSDSVLSLRFNTDILTVVWDELFKAEAPVFSKRRKAFAFIGSNVPVLMETI